MKTITALYLVSVVALVAALLHARAGAADSAPRPQIDWEAVAACVFERLNTISSFSFADTGRVIRFCIEVDPYVRP